MKRAIAIIPKFILLLWFPIVIIGLIILSDLAVSIPALSTKQAPSYTEEKFATVRNGMSAHEVIALMGRPLSVERRFSGTNVIFEWWFTHPKEPLDGWGSWEARMLVISNGNVAESFCRSLQNH